MPDEMKGEVIWCFVVVRPGAVRSQALGSELVEIVAGQLGKAFAPSRVVFVDELPRTATGKTQRFKLRIRAVSISGGR
jgi:acyl-coenzyme A synthetase/AMP-(fatty) acid ligase